MPERRTLFLFLYRKGHLTECKVYRSNSVLFRILSLGGQSGLVLKGKLWLTEIILAKIKLHLHLTVLDLR